MASLGDAASLDALGLGSAQLQAVSAAVMQPPPETSLTFMPTPGAFTQPSIQAGPTKLFVGSIPTGTTREMLVEEFGKFGPVAEVFLKGATDDQGRLWAFVTFVSPESAAAAAAGLNEKFPFPGALRPLAVSFARSASAAPMDGGSGMALAAAAAVNPGIAPAATGLSGPTKLFVGSIPGGTSAEQIKSEFGRFGAVMDVFLKQDGAEPNRMWGFVTYDNAASASSAVSAFHERLVLPGGSRPCAVSFARSSQAQHSMAAASLTTPSLGPNGVGATKLFIGTIPMGTTEAMLRTEFEKFGIVTEVFLKNDSKDPNRMWGFLSYADPQSAAVAVSSLHEKLMMPGSVRPLAVTFAKNSGPPRQSNAMSSPMPISGGQMLQVNDSAWKVYYTAEGTPYYHHAATNTTQWERPPELDVPASAQAGAVGSFGLPSAQAGQGMFSASAAAATSAAPTDYAAMVGGVVAGQSRASPY